MARHSQFFLINIVLAFTLSANAAEPDLASTMARFSGGEYETTLEDFRKLHRQNPEDANLSFQLGRSLYINRDLEAAREVLEDNVERHPNHAESHYVLGSVLLTLVNEVNLFRKPGLAKRAVNAWERTYEIDPNHHEALYGIVSFYLSAPGIAGGDFQKGKIKLAELKELSQPWATLTKASMLAKEKQFDAAEKTFRLAIDGIPGRAFPTLMLANLYLTQEEFEQANAALGEYHGRAKTWNDPAEAQTALLAARVYEGLNQKDLAKQAYETVLNSVATVPEKDRAKDALRQLQSR